MADHNIVQTDSIYGVTYQVSPASSGPTGNYLVPPTTPVATDKLYKVNTVFVVNTSTTTDYEASVYHYIAKNYNNAPGTGWLAQNVVVPAKSNIVIVSSDNPIYLKENDYLACYSNVVSTLQYTVSYEIIS